MNYDTFSQDHDTFFFSTFQPFKSKLFSNSSWLSMNVITNNTTFLGFKLNPNYS